MKTQTSMQMFQYWNRLRAGAPAPRRTQIEPSDIRDILSQTFILESHNNSSDMSFRLAGTAINNLLGRHLRGTALRDLFQEPNRPVVSRLMRNCYQDRSIVVLGLDGVSRSGRQTLLEVLILPLEDEAEGHRILGCLSPHQYQFWHGLEPVTDIGLHSIRIVDPEREPLFLANRPEFELPPTLSPSEENLRLESPSSLSRGVQLLIIQGGKS
jgi:hypothetical protein